MKPVEYFCEVKFDVQVVGSCRFAEEDRFSITQKQFDEGGGCLAGVVSGNIINWIGSVANRFAENVKYRVCEYHDHGIHGDMIIRKGWIELPGKVEVGSVKGS